MCLELKWVIQKSRYNVKSLAKILEGCEQSIQLRVCKHPKKTNKRASRKDNMNEGLENIKQIDDLENKVKKLSDHLASMCCQADEDTPSEHRTEHFRSTMDDAYEYLEKINYFKKG